MKFKENLRYLRKLNKMSQNDLANRLGYKSFTTIQKWEDGTSFPKVENLNALSDIFHVELDHLLNIDLRAEKVAVPILGEVKAGYDMYADENILGYEYCDLKDYGAGEYFYLKVKGDSMKDDRIQDGDIVYVRRQDYLNNHELGVFLLESSEVTIKRAVFGKNSVTLHASNPKYKDRVYPSDDVRVLGKVLHSKVIFS
ncbi:MAG: helix-turn-helix domain-containing protein [Erysipelotrichaceae bacterium]|nr:helix-turn-helix domain-containing protein [Erysipelotrichaceae bacterium]